MRKYGRAVLTVLLFAAGLSLLLYPYVSNKWNTYRQSLLMSDYTAKVEALGDTVNYDEQWQRADAYNLSLLPSILPDSFAIAAADGVPGEEYMNCLNLTGDGIMGVVEIPKIKVTVPIYHTTEETVLQIAAGHLEGSSLPVGGENTHAVVAAHRGLPSAALFTDLDKLEEGDHFLIKVLDDTLAYEVDKISVVEPDDTNALQVENGRDLVTLLTCTPYGVNSHRLMVRGHRVPYEEEIVAKEEKQVVVSMHTNYGFWVILGLVVTALVIGIMAFITRRNEKKSLANNAVAETAAEDVAEIPAEEVPAETNPETPEEVPAETNPETPEEQLPKEEDNA